MAKNTKNHNAEENVEQAITSAEHFIERYKKHIIYGVSAVVLIVALSLAYQNFYRKPRIKEALAQTFVAEQYFRADSFATALNGDGNSYGFKKVIDEYGSMGGESIYLYAGICELQLGNYKEALSYLKKYKSDDPIMQARAMCNIGDCHAGLKENEKALQYYLDAASYNDNDLAAGYLLKAGLMYEELGKNDKAIETYTQIKDKYPQTIEGYEIDKYIARLQQ